MAFFIEIEKNNPKICIETQKTEQPKQKQNKSKTEQNRKKKQKQNKTKEGIMLPDI